MSVQENLHSHPMEAQSTNTNIFCLLHILLTWYIWLRYKCLLFGRYASEKAVGKVDDLSILMPRITKKERLYAQLTFLLTYIFHRVTPYFVSQKVRLPSAFLAVGVLWTRRLSDHLIPFWQLSALLATWRTSYLAHSQPP